MLLGVEIDKKAVGVIASASRFTPRVANRLLKRVRDYAQIKDMQSVTAIVAKEALGMLEIDSCGLENTDRKILKAIAVNFDGGPVGLKSVAAAIAEEEGTIEEVYEPYLMRIGFLARTSKGRIITTAGCRHLGIEPKNETLFS